MPAKKPVRSITSAKAAKPEPSSTPAVPTGSGRAGVVAIVAVCVIVAALVIAIRDGSEPEAAAADAKVAAAAAHATQPTAAVTSKAKTSATSAAATTTAASSSESAVAKPSGLSATVTVAGCLERTGDGFRLKDTSGAEAPKSRSWKTGFFKKSSASIDVVDAANGLKLANYAGSRVSVTGTLIDREMRAHSLQRLQGACK